MKDLIKMMIEQALDELMEPQEPTVYFDMDGVLANFSGKVHENPDAAAAKAELDAFLAADPELADLHPDEVKMLLKGEQTDPKMKKLKKLYQKHEGLLYKVASKLGHFRDLEPFPGIFEMIEAATRLTGKKPHILTAPMTRHPKCEEEKIEWVKMHGLDKVTDEFHCTKNKEAFANSEFDILVDDRPKYANRFKNAGGTAILHTDSASSIKELEEVIARLKGMNEVNAIGVGGGALQSSGKISGTGGTPLGKDMSKEHERMWSGDEPGSHRVTKEAFEGHSPAEVFVHHAEDFIPEPVDVILEPVGPAMVDIVDVESKEMLQGHGSKALKNLTKLADKLGVKLVASVETDDPYTAQEAEEFGWMRDYKAIEWLERFGFVLQYQDEHEARLERNPSLNEERIGSRGSVDYFQMGSSLPDHLYNLDSKGRATRDPGLGGNVDKKKRKKRETKKKVKDRPGKRWYDK